MLVNVHSWLGGELRDGWEVSFQEKEGKMAKNSYLQTPLYLEEEIQHNQE